MVLSEHLVSTAKRATELPSTVGTCLGMAVSCCLLLLIFYNLVPTLLSVPFMGNSNNRGELYPLFLTALHPDQCFTITLTLII